MEQFKVQHYLSAHPGSPFPKFQHLSEDDATALRCRIIERCGLGEMLSPLDMTKAIRARQQPISQVNAESSEFRLDVAVAAVGICPRPLVYINWYRYDDIDEIGFADFARQFRDIWYPSSDDIDLFDDSLTWILSIDHDGHLSVLI